MAYRFKESMGGLLKMALLTGVLAGVLSVFLGGFLAGFGNTAVGGMLVSLVLIVVLVLVKKSVKIDETTLYDFVLFLGAIVFFGSLLGMIFPAATTYILAVGDTLKVSALLFTFLYIALAELILAKAGVKELK